MDFSSDLHCLQTLAPSISEYSFLCMLHAEQLGDAYALQIFPFRMVDKRFRLENLFSLAGMQRMFCLEDLVYQLDKALTLDRH